MLSKKLGIKYKNNKINNKNVNRKKVIITVINRDKQNSCERFAEKER